MPLTAPGRPNLSRASETAQESSLARREIISFMAASGHVIAERAFDFVRSDGFAIIQSREDGIDDPLGFVLVKVLDKPVKKMLARQRVINLGFFIVVL